MKLAAVVLTVVTGAAIAIGLSNVNDVAAPTPAVSENPELLKLDNANNDVAHPSGRKTPSWVPSGAVVAPEMTNEQFTQYLIDIGRLPQGAIPKGTPPVEAEGSGPR